MISQSLPNSCLVVVLAAGVVDVAPASCSATSSESASISSVVSSTSSAHGQRSLTIHRILLINSNASLGSVSSILKVYCLHFGSPELLLNSRPLNPVLGCTIAYVPTILFLFCLGEAINSASAASNGLANQSDILPK